jgi:hypothetical protein
MAEGKMTNRDEKGQTLVEMALALPILLILLLGGYASTRTAFLKSRAESASFTQALRVGRNLRGIERELSESIFPEGKKVTIRSGRKGKSRLLPRPFPLLAGKTASTVEARKTWKEIGGAQWLPPVRISQKAELHVNCWGQDSSSGKSIRRYIRGLVVLGAIR